MSKLIEAAGRKYGLRTFLDEKNIQGGDPIPETLRANLRACDELLVLLTPASVRREWVLVEITGAWMLGKRIVAIMDHVQPKDMPKVIANCLAIDLNDFDTYIAQVKNRAQKAQTT